jgi:thiosulfate/3-mercaptopyruvate sulfurtransferase
LFVYESCFGVAHKQQELVNASMQVRRAKLAGRMPSAISLPYKQILNADGHLMQFDALVDTFQEAGVNLSKPVLVYCNGGVSACVVATALESVGHRQWSVYDGSWNEYGNEQGVPVATD